MIGGDDVALGREPNEGRPNVRGGMRAFEGRNDLVQRVPAVEQRQQIVMERAVQQGIERFRNQQRLPFADIAELQVRGERGERD